MHQYSVRNVATSGYTLIELLVVLTIIAILSAIVSVALSDNLRLGRDAERQANLQVIKTAIEEYRIKNGRYPEMGCTPAQITAAGGWSRQEDCYEFASGLGAVLPQIPRDPSPGSGDGYVYRTNTEGTVFKLMVRGTVEQTVTVEHPLHACDSTLCGASCTDAATYSSSYAAWGGFADGATDVEVRDATSVVICAM